VAGAAGEQVDGARVGHHRVDHRSARSGPVGDDVLERLRQRRERHLLAQVLR
jgi:hypothetical protein